MLAATTNVIGLDMGFANVGWAVAELNATGLGLAVLELGIIRTTKSTRRAHVLASSDLHRRGQEIARSLESLIELYRPAVICAEAISLPRNASTSAMLGRGWGIVDALCASHGLSLVEASPQDVKRASAGYPT